VLDNRARHSVSETWSFIQSTAPLWGSIRIRGGRRVHPAFIVHLLTQSREREKWILDCKKEEFKELLNAIAESYTTRLNWLGPFPCVLDEEDQRHSASANTSVFRVMRNRIYITKDLDLVELSQDWMIALRISNLGDLHQEYCRLSQRIIDAANRSVPRTAFQRLRFWKK
jgi:hypothetical protein